LFAFCDSALNLPSDNWLCCVVACISKKTGWEGRKILCA